MVLARFVSCQGHGAVLWFFHSRENAMSDFNPGRRRVAQAVGAGLLLPGLAPVQQAPHQAWRQALPAPLLLERQASESMGRPEPQVRWCSME